MKTSLLTTLANKYRSTVTKMAKRYAATLATPHGPMKGLRVVVPRAGKSPLVAEFGGIPLRTQQQVTQITDGVLTLGSHRSERLQRLRAEVCELCGGTDALEVHHVRRLADLKQVGRREKPLWVQRMAALRRKTLIVCQPCHRAIHHGTPRAMATHLNR